MKLLRELTELQQEHGFLHEDQLRSLARRLNVPLYRLEELTSFYPHFRGAPRPGLCVEVCRDVTCAMFDSEELLQRLKSETETDDGVEVHDVSCLGRCDTAPAVSLNEMPYPPDVLADVSTMRAWVQGERVDAAGAEITDSPRTWKCDPYQTRAEHYGTVRSLAQSGRKLAETSIERLKQSQLCGMGGAGFPTGMKWQLVASEPALPKYVICNADESEPGTFKDREILRHLPHLVIEGMLLAALTIQAEHGIVYVRHEYAPERRVLEAALTAARQSGQLGPDAAGSGQAFDIEVFVSPGGYILGEETALLEALEDRRGEPRNKPPYPGTHGLWGKPTLINNVETFALATSIIHHGADWWRDQGRTGFAGLKFTSVSGDVQNAGVYEVPVGTAVGELIQLAGGVRDGKSLKAFLPGGASSSFLPAEKAETPLDFEAMKAAGSMLGTGAVLVIAADRDLFDLATNMVRFFRNESCGKCVPCRVGSETAVALLEAVAAGACSSKKLAALPELGEALEQTSICGLGQVALNPILSMMKHFPDDVPNGLPD